MFFVLLLLSVSGVAAHLYAALNNTLVRNGRWSSTKTGLEKRVIGARTYANSRQTLAAEHLNLGLWHGYQEVLYTEPLTIEEISFRFSLSENAYLSFVFGKSAQGFSGLRLSCFGALPSLYFVAGPDGEFSQSIPVQTPGLEVERWSDLQMIFSEDGAAVFLDGRGLGTIPMELTGAGRFGFRGGQQPAFVDDVRVSYAGSKRELRESFFAWGSFAWAFGGIASALLLGFLITRSILLRLPIPSGKRVGVGLALAVGVLIASSLALFVYRTSFAKSGPGYDPAAEEVWAREEAQRVLAGLQSEYSKSGGAQVRRVLVFGTSQTWGAGASRSEETFVRVLERELNARTDGLSFECIAAGFSAARAPLLRELYDERLLDFDPRVVIVNLSNNDTDPEAFGALLEHVARCNAARGIATLFALEANSIERQPGELPLHPVMRRLGAELSIPVCDVHAQLKERCDSGLLWWDFVHPTSYGHRLVADCLLAALDPLLSR